MNWGPVNYNYPKMCIASNHSGKSIRHTSLVVTALSYDTMEFCRPEMIPRLMLSTQVASPSSGQTSSTRPSTRAKRTARSWRARLYSHDLSTWSRRP